MRPAKWTKEEDEILRSEYPHVSTEEFRQRYLPHRNLRGISVRANRLGVHKTTEFRSIAQQGSNNHFAGKSHSNQTKSKMKSVWDERKSDPEWTHNWIGRNHNDETKKQMSDFRKEYYQTHDGPFKGKYHTEETKAKMSKPRNWTPESLDRIRQAVISKPAGGYGNWQLYTKKDGEDIWLQSSYEMRLAAALDKWDFKWDRNTGARRVAWEDIEGKEHYYYPDFLVWVDDNEFIVETKGEHLINDFDVVTKTTRAIEEWGESFLFMTLEDIETFEDSGVLVKE